jgi:hemoglobin
VASSLLDELGGVTGLRATVDDLYRRLLADPELAPYFAGTDLQRIRAHMTDFLVAVVDGPDAYEGRDLEVAHAHLWITDAAFDATASHLLDALEQRQVRSALLDSVLDRVAPFRDAVVTQP